MQENTASQFYSPKIRREFGCKNQYPYTISVNRLPWLRHINTVAAKIHTSIIQDRHDGVQDSSHKAAILPGETDRGHRYIQDNAVIYMSSNHTERAKTVLVTGATAFHQTPAKTWISQPDNIRLADKIETFWFDLKTHFYKLSYCKLFPVPNPTNSSVTYGMLK